MDPPPRRRTPIGAATPTVWIVAVCALAALLTTRGSTAVPPQPWGLWALAAWVGAFGWLAWRDGRGRRPSRAWMVALLVALGLIGAQDLFRPVLTHSHDVHHHAWGFYAVWRTILDGDWLPAWIPYLGIGMPLLSLYSPLSFLLGVPAQAAGASPVDAFRWVLAVAQVGSAALTYVSLRWLGARRIGGLVGAAACVLGPYHLFDQTSRGALGECVAFAVAPLFLAAAWKLLADDDRRAPWIFAVASAALLFAHALSLVACLLALSFLLPLAWWHGRRLPTRVHLRRLRRFVLAALLGAGLGAAWWLPLAFDLQHLAVESYVPGAAGFAERSTTITEPWVRRGWPGYRVRTPWSRGGEPNLSIPQYFGWGLTALCLVACFGARRADLRVDAGEDAAAEADGDTAAAPGWPWAVVAFLLVVAAMRPFAPWIGELPAVSTLIFPTRLHLPATVAAALAGGLALSRLLGVVGEHRGRWLSVAVVALLAWDAVPYLGSPKLLPELPEQGMVHYVGGEAVPVELAGARNRLLRVEEAFLPPAGYELRVGNLRRVYAEYQPRELWDAYFSHWSMWPQKRQLSELLGAQLRFSEFAPGPLRLDPEPYARWVAAGRSPRALEWARSGGSIRVELPPDRGTGRIALMEMAYPGWRLGVDGGAPRALTRRPGEPFLSAEVGSEARFVVFEYGHFDPPYRRAALWISLASLVVLGVAGRGRQRAAPQPATESSS